MPLDEILKQVPALAVFAFICVKFLQAMALRDKNSMNHLSELTEAIRQNSTILGEIKTLLVRINGRAKV